MPRPSSHEEASFDSNERLSGLTCALEMESNAAKIIHLLSCRISQSSELASRARIYATRLRFNVERINALLPQEARISFEADPGALPELIIHAMSPDKAASVLERFLIDRVEAPAFSAHMGVSQAAIQRICQKLLREQRKISAWATGYRLRRTLSRAAEPEQAPPRRATGSPLAIAAGPAETEDSGEADAPDTHRAIEAPHASLPFDHRPPQIVRWM